MEGSEDYSEPIYNFMIVISHVPPKNVRGNFQQSPRKAAWKIIPNRFTNYATRLYRMRVHITIHTTDTIGSKGCKHFLHPLSRQLYSTIIVGGVIISVTPFGFCMLSAFILGSSFSGQYKNIPHSGNTGNNKPLLSWKHPLSPAAPLPSCWSGSVWSGSGSLATLWSFLNKNHIRQSHSYRIKRFCPSVRPPVKALYFLQLYPLKTDKQAFSYSSFSAVISVPAAWSCTGKALVFLLFCIASMLLLYGEYIEL